MMKPSLETKSKHAVITIMHLGIFDTILTGACSFGGSEEDGNDEGVNFYNIDLEIFFRAESRARIWNSEKKI